MPTAPPTAYVGPADPTLATADALTPASDFLTRQRAFLAAATTDNTRRAYRGALRHFQVWGGDLPADEDMLLRYLLTHAGQLNPRTLSLRLTAISQWHLQQGFVDPAATPTVRKTLAGITRTHGKPARKAVALALADLERIVTCLVGRDTLTAHRDSAILQLAYFGALRRSEVVRLDLTDLTWEARGLLIMLTRSKTDQGGSGIVKAIPYGDALCCPATAVRTWVRIAGIERGPLFRSINKWGVLGSAALHASSVNLILADCARQAGVHGAASLSSHSLRRGMATSAYRAGASLRDIKRQGGWRHDATVQGYIDDADRFEANAAAQLLRTKR